MAYLLDSDVFIQAKNLHYGMDFCPAFWEWLDAANAKKALFSIEKVGDELIAGSDQLAEWARERGDSFFLPPDQTIIPVLSQLAEWSRKQQYRPAAINEFLQGADYYLIAAAAAGKHVVVTHEVPSDGTKRIKIPTACISLKVKCMTPYEMLRTEKARFVLPSK